MFDPKKRSEEKKRGFRFLACWAVLIACGIIEKRIYGHPDRMVFYHLPAALFLVMACYELSAPFRRRNQLARQIFEKARLSIGK